MPLIFAGFCQARTLAEHRMLHFQEDLQKLQCNFCSQSFHDRSQLKSHLRQTHPEQKPAFVCSICGKDFSRNCDLRRHSLTHFNHESTAEQLSVITAK